MTDNEIIKILECCIMETYCKSCPLHSEFSANCVTIALKNALDLITRQQREIENLKVENQSLRSAANSLKMHYEEAQTEIESLKIFRGYAEKKANDYKTMRDKYLNAKSEAYKEFAEKLKHFIIPQKADGYTREIILKRDIDNLLKEMAGGNSDL